MGPRRDLRAPQRPLLLHPPPLKIVRIGVNNPPQKGLCRTKVIELGDLAYGHTTSAGQTEVLGAHTTSKEANNELFIFRKEGGHWKIHRYLFATSNPPAAN